MKANQTRSECIWCVRTVCSYSCKSGFMSRIFWSISRDAYNKISTNMRKYGIYVEWATLLLLWRLCLGCVNAANFPSLTQRSEQEPRSGEPTPYQPPMFISFSIVSYFCHYCFVTDLHNSLRWMQPIFVVTSAPQLREMTKGKTCFYAMRHNRREQKKRNVSAIVSEFFDYFLKNQKSRNICGSQDALNVCHSRKCSSHFLGRRWIEMNHLSRDSSAFQPHFIWRTHLAHFRWIISSAA